MQDEKIRTTEVERPIDGDLRGWRALPHEVRVVAKGVIVVLVISLLVMLKVVYSRLSSSLSGFRDRAAANEYYRPFANDKAEATGPLDPRRSHRSGLFCSIIGSFVPRGSRCG